MAKTENGRTTRTDAARRGRLAEMLKAVSDPVRLEILSTLRKRGCCSCDEVAPDEPGCCVCDVEEMIGLSQPTISHHLAILQRAGLVTAAKCGRWVYYRRNEEAISALAEELARTV
jgi:ArsR family transcriptional regulator